LIENNPIYFKLFKDGRIDFEKIARWGDDESELETTIELTQEEEEEMMEVLRKNGASNTTHSEESPVMLLEEPPALVSKEADARAKLGARGSGEVPAELLARRTNEYIAPWDDKLFDAKSFPHLFPYGTGGVPGGKHGLADAELERLHLKRGGDRRFQRSMPYVFEKYTRRTRKAAGGVALIASSQMGLEDGGNAPMANAALGGVVLGNPFSELGACSTAEEVLVALEKDDGRVLKTLLKRLEPFSRGLAGSPLHIANERKQLFAMMASKAVTSKGMLAIFGTNAPCDRFNPELYDIVKPDGGSLTAAEKAALLRSHPALAARIFNSRVSAMFDEVYKGEAMPFGKVTDFWVRVEFQARGSPHVHFLLWIDNKELGITPSSLHDETWPRVQDFVRQRLSCSLPPVGRSVWKAAKEVDDDLMKAEREKELLVEGKADFRPAYGEFDEDHPCSRRLLDLYDIDFGMQGKEYWKYKGGDMEEKEDPRSYVSEEAHSHFRRVLLAVQMHYCFFTCHKYGHIDDCRFGAPWKTHEEVELQVHVDKRGRTREKVEAPRNNNHMNRHCAYPHVACCWGGNTDFSYIGDEYGCCVYCGSYVSKAEEPDCCVMANLIASAITRRQDHTARECLRAVLNSMLRSVLVGGTQACWFLLNLPYVRKSRIVVSVNALRREDMTTRFRSLPELKDAMEEEGKDASAVDNSPSSNIGRRNAYAAFVKCQLQLPEDAATGPIATFAAFLSRYRLSKHKAKSGPKDRTTDGASGDHDRQPTLENLFDDGCAEQQAEHSGSDGEEEGTGKSNKRKRAPWKQLDTRLLVDSATGAVKDGSAKNFLLGNVRCSWMATQVVLNLSPHIPYKDDDDR
jgi:hypothetical protein